MGGLGGRDAPTSVLEDCRWTPCYDCGVCPGLSLVHDTGYDGGTNLPAGRVSLPVLPTGLGGSPDLPTPAERYVGG